MNIKYEEVKDWKLVEQYLKEAKEDTVSNIINKTINELWIKELENLLKEKEEREGTKK